MPLGKAANQDEVWEKIQYETAYDHMLERLDEPMKIDAKDDEEHYFVDLKLQKHWDNMRGWAEKALDKKANAQHTEYWDKTAARREGMIAERNVLLAKGTLS